MTFSSLSNTENDRCLLLASVEKKIFAPFSNKLFFKLNEKNYLFNHLLNLSQKIQNQYMSINFLRLYN